jgi:two-component system response regulator DesR
VTGADPSTIVRLLVVDDHPVVITGVQHLLQGSRFRVVGHANSRADCVSVARDCAPDIIILDLRMGQDLAPDVCRDLARAGVAAPTLILTGHEDRELLRACLDVGVAGILLKDIGDAAHLARALERILNGKLVLDDRLETLRSAPDDISVAPTCLTSREHEMLRLLARGMTSREISDELFLSVNTVRSYVQSLLTKLDARTRIEAVAIARERRLI